MPRSINRCYLQSFFSKAVFSLALALPASSAWAQVTGGFDRIAPAYGSSAEMNRQPDFWISEVQLKPVRILWVDEVDPISGQKTPVQVWYLAWRAQIRDLPAYEAPDAKPQNTLDPPPGPMKFVPQATLVTYSNPETEVPTKVIQDEIFPAAMTQIRRIERNDYKDLVESVQDLPAAVPAGTEDSQWIYGAATFRGMNPDTRFFKVILSGFTNAYEVRGEGADQKVWRKVLVQKFFRPGDRFDPNSKEFQYAGNPEWVYVPDEKPTDISVK